LVVRVPFKVQLPLVSKKTIPKLLTVAACLLPSLPSFACQDFSDFYRAIDDEFQLVESQLLPLLEECSENSEYFSLLGTVQLRSGDFFAALENLERALLLNPDNGSALVDYAEVLFQQGQLLSAVEINAQLLSREDLPADLSQAIADRQRRWRGLMSETSSILGVSVGYDNNLNSAPMGRQLALTLSGQSVVLDVSPEFLAAGGTYANVAAGIARNSAGRDISSRMSGQIRGRFGENSSYEVLQASSQFAFAQSGDTPRWNATLGFDHLNYGGNDIFSSSTLRASYLARQGKACGIYPRLAIQYQLFHIQESLSGIESSLGVGVDCQLPIGKTVNRLAIEVSALTNRALQSSRLGQDRNGWQVNLAWRRQVGPGQASAQYSFTDLNDDEGFSPIFDDGARRHESLSSIYLQYSIPTRRLGAAAQIVASVSYYNQDSTVGLFRTQGANVEIGINWGF
jgi:tetratricopeptide (TPR) repeat protein